MREKKSGKINIWQAVLKLDRLVFTTREIAAATRMSLSSASQGLSRLHEKKIVKKTARGVWALAYDRRFSAFMLVPFLSPAHQSYVSFISAMHIYGMISQIPQTITVASTTHTKKITTPLGTYSIHQIDPSFFAGFDWHESGNFLIATPEKALIDSLYLSSRRGKNYSSFPELEFPRNFSVSKAKEWANQIKDSRIRRSVLMKLKIIMGGRRDDRGSGSPPSRG